MVEARRRAAFRAEREMPPVYEWDLGDPRLSRRWDVPTDTEDFAEENWRRTQYGPQPDDCQPAPGTLAAVWSAALASLWARDAHSIGTRLRGSAVAAVAQAARLAFVAPPARSPREIEDDVVAWVDGLHAPEDILQAVTALPLEHAALLRLAEYNRHVAAVALMGFPFWIRPLSEWMHRPVWPADAYGDMLRHLFAHYPVPDFLCRDLVKQDGGSLPLSLPADHRSSPVKFVNALAWLVLRGAGRQRRPRRAAAAMGAVARTDCHHTEACTHAHDLADALPRGELRRLGGGPIEERRLGAVDGTHRYGYGHRRDEGEWEGALWTTWPERRRAFWSGTVQWLVRHRTQLDDAEVAAVLHWANHEEYEHGTFSWQQRGLARTLAAAHRYAARLSVVRDTTPRTWAGHGWDWTWDEWALSELTSSLALQEEGAVQRHCVGSYANYCVAGHSAIFQLRHAGMRCATIEVAPRTFSIVQARGRYNSPVTPEQHDVLKRWRAAMLAGSATPGTIAAPD